MWAKGREDPDYKCKGIVKSMQNGRSERDKNVGDLLRIVSYMRMT